MAFINIMVYNIAYRLLKHVYNKEVIYRMKIIKTEDAIGKPLLHDITEVKDGFKGARFKRGHIITKDDIEVLLDLGKKHTYILDESIREIHEEDAARRLSEIAKTDNTHFTPISEGKTVLMADINGFFVINRPLLKSINSIGDITIATIPSHYPATKGNKLANIRIVPLMCDEKEIIKAEEYAKGQWLFKLLPYQFKKVGIIITGSEIYSGRIKDKFEPVIRKKLQNYPHEVIGVKICDDDEEMLCKAADELTQKGANLLIFTGGMSVDADDVTPRAIKNMGVNLVSHGVPSAPGNMTLLAYKNGATYVGVPTAAIALPTTVLDTLLPSIFSNYDTTKEDLINLGEGGLCMSCNVCHFPNCTFGKW